ncbi:hypothetical protein QQP08_021877 [Theobroma cacao]|nr:hypothetical protein QQP08_021877 [Theobroma cacao]
MNENRIMSSRRSWGASFCRLLVVTVDRTFLLLSSQQPLFPACKPLLSYSQRYH